MASEHEPESEQSAPAPERTEAAPERIEPTTERIEPTTERIEPQRFSVQFTASEEYVKLVEEAQALSGSRTSLDELHLRAMRALVAELECQKYAVTARPRQRSASAPENRAEKPVAEEPGAETRTTEAPPSDPPRRRGRYIPAEVRRSVFQRDEGRCTFTDSAGQRCRETRDLELHHDLAFALGGEHTASNISLRCRAHNALAAEEDFGKEFIERQRESEHERWTLVESEDRAGC